MRLGCGAGAVAVAVAVAVAQWLAGLAAGPLRQPAGGPREAEARDHQAALSGSATKGFLVESAGLAEALDISHFGGWRTFTAARQ